MKKVTHFYLALLFFFVNYCTIISQNGQGDVIEIYFTQAINSKYQSDLHYPHVIGGNLVKSRIIQQINDSKSTIDIALYNNSDNNIVTALKNAKTRGVRVRYMADEGTSNYALEGNINFPVLYTSIGDGIMHNKFIISDADTDAANLMIGSANFTSNGFNEDANNVLFIKDKALAQTFKVEFEEMWGSTGPNPGNNPKSGSSKSDNTNHNFTIAGIPIELYFSPSDGTGNKIEQALISADHSIRFAMYTFTSESLSSRIVQKKNQGISVRGITDNNVGSSGKLQYMQQNGVDVLEHTPSSLLHHKYAVVDAENPDSDPVVITGSHNWTYSADNINDETTLIIHDLSIARLYVAEFNSRFCELAPWDCNLISAEQLVDLKFNLYPTLAKEFIQIDLPQSSTEAISLSIFDNTGKPFIFKKYYSGLNDALFIGDLPAGIYYAQIIQGNHQKTMRFVKM